MKNFLCASLLCFCLLFSGGVFHQLGPKATSAPIGGHPAPFCHAAVSRSETGSLTLLQTAEGEVFRPGQQTTVRLFGQQTDGPFVTGLRIEVEQPGEKTLILQPAVNQGYQPHLLVGPFTSSGTDQIFLGMSTGGSGGFGVFYLYDLTDGRPSLLFDFEQWPFRDTARYEDGFRVRVQTEQESFLIDLSDRPYEQLAPLYQPDGRLIAPKTADVSDLNYVFPAFQSESGLFFLMAFQRITGLYSADLLGYLIRQMTFEDQTLKPIYTLVGVTGASNPHPLGPLSAGLKA